MGSAAGRTRKASVIIVGLDHSGKTTVLARLKAPEAVRNEHVPPPAPTTGCTVDHFQARALQLTVMDLSGERRYRNMWELYYKTCHGVIFVLDSSDRLRLALARDELHQLLAHPDLRARGSVPLLVLINKRDLPDALPAQACTALLGLEGVAGEDRPWRVSATCGLTGEGLEEGVEWFTEQVKEAVTSAREQEPAGE